MKKFYNFIETDLKNDFSMQKIRPIPVELENLDSPERFVPVKSKTLTSKYGKTKEVMVDESNLTKSEFQKQCKYLKSKFGYDNCSDWCEKNWGCSEDMNNQILLQTKNEMLLIYTTHWTPNLQFIKFLANKFQKLNFKDEYYCPEAQYAGSYTIENGIEELYEPSFQTLYFVKDENDLFYKYVETYEESLGYDEIEYIDIIDKDWKKAFSNLSSTINSITVSNWNEVEKYFSSNY